MPPSARHPTRSTAKDVSPSGTRKEESELVAQDHAQEATVNRQRAAARVINEAQRQELVHEMADPGPGGTDHLGQVFLIDSGMHWQWGRRVAPALKGVGVQSRFSFTPAAL